MERNIVKHIKKSQGFLITLKKVKNDQLPKIKNQIIS